MNEILKAMFFQAAPEFQVCIDRFGAEIHRLISD